MDYQHYQKSLINLLKSSSLFPSPSPFFVKIKHFADAHISRYSHRAIRAVKNLKSTAKKFFYEKTTLVTKYVLKLREEKKRVKKKVVDSVTKHVNSSSVIPINTSYLVPISEQVYYESNWNIPIIPAEETPLAGYLEWLDNRISDETIDDHYHYNYNYDYDHHNNDDLIGDSSNDIDHLAESFISRCYEKFRIEKQESYRRYQEMMARSL